MSVIPKSKYRGFGPLPERIVQIGESGSLSVVTDLLVQSCNKEMFP